MLQRVNNKNIKHAANPNEGVTRIRWNQRAYKKKGRMEKNEGGGIYFLVRARETIVRSVR
jgi:hypothetical protein